ncbi:hypothetical protein ID850_10230 [Xenorhabdus sp. Flor]|uniref:hypothetical protein n=1 Tax=Xenorhabdus cabanillasii TaxID=351673 RepID=UPI0019AA288B|nr:hypothetical protein [Xenorhabdus sp. Flor]MBD2815135.1 hypothetical protein [Xenorhabdus sp. Flor]
MNDVKIQEQNISQETLADIEKSLDDLFELVKSIVKTLFDANIISVTLEKIIEVVIGSIVDLIKKILTAIYSKN